ncbi:MAG TPA: VOC family protein [Candidatus Binataceae bacterium]|nr:VOC family protein [Candidatus Binataceae bacterium]
MIKRLERLEVATADLDDAAAIYERNFGFSVRRKAGSDEAAIAIGECEIRLRADAGAAEIIAAQGEGLAAIWLEADDLDAVAAALDAAHVARHAIRREGDRRVLEVDPQAANMVPLFIFDHRN